MLKCVLKKFGYVAEKELNQQLNFARSVGKRLDEHRELVESLVERSSFLDEYDWHVGHMATQDDYLMRLFWMVHGSWPEEFIKQRRDIRVRPRPAILGECRLPEYISSN